MHPLDGETIGVLVAPRQLLTMQHRLLQLHVLTVQCTRVEGCWFKSRHRNGICLLAVSLHRVGSIGHIHSENFYHFYSTAHSHSISTHNQFMSKDTYEITILDIKMSLCYFSIQLYDCLGKLYEAVPTSCTQKC